MRLYNGYALDPEIPVSPHMRIAEIGTGTAVWLLDVASELPETVQLDGYDISGDQFPHQSQLPANVTLGTMDAFGPMPPQLIEQYDVVHMRYFAPVVKDNDPSVVIKNVVKLLTRGYLQWEDGNFDRMVARGKEAEALRPIVKSLYNAGGILYEWPGQIEQHVTKGGLNLHKIKTNDFNPAVSGLASKYFVSGMLELIEVIYSRDFNPSLPTKAESQEVASKVVEALKIGGAFHYSPISLLAQKPNIA
ncbi:N-methyltransferase tcpN [Cladobotryum mycophilum]|uniref:N-methyltransferase tcpN n=1 Tax=Cladobotryum mycophilum TaxID=491253 RepID=A0ABR0SMZ7_9HYPO